MALTLKKGAAFDRWFDVPGGDGAKVLLRERSAAEAVIASETLLTKASIGGDISGDIEALYLDAIAEWQGIEDESGKALKCTMPNKRLFLHQPGFIHFLRESLKELREEAEKAREDAEKN